MKDKKKIVITLFCVISVLLIAVGVTYSIFTYTKQGETENTVTSGKLTFLYTENTGTGTGINISNAFPVSDELGMTYSSDDQVFDFKVESEIIGNATIPYEVTVKKLDSSTLDEDYVKLYLTDTTENEEDDLMPPLRYSELPTSSTKEDEKQIYFDTVEANEDYEKDFRLRMWVADDSNQDDVNGKSFTIKVGVYSNSDIIKQRINVLDVIAIDNNNGTDLNASSILISGSKKQSLLNKLVSEGYIENTNLVNVIAEIDTDDFDDIANTTINVSRIANIGDKVVVFHYDDENSEWEYITTADVTNDKTIVVDFNSFSPVGLVTVKNDDFTGINRQSSGGNVTWNDANSNNQKDVGDILTIGDENFYIISNDGTKVRALAEWNLNVGYVVTKNGEERYSTSDMGIWDIIQEYREERYSNLTYTMLNPTEIKQDPNMNSFSKKEGKTTYNTNKGVISFGYAEFFDDPVYEKYGYWCINNDYYDYETASQILDVYGKGKTWNEIKYGDNEIAPYVYDDNSRIKPYVDQYAAKLSNIYGKTIKANLITYEELLSLGCDNSYCSNDTPEWVTQRSYWTGSAQDWWNVYAIINYGTFTSSSGVTYYDVGSLGIRPVIELATKDIRN